MPRFLRQFGLRTLLLFCLLVAIVFGLLRWQMDGIHRQHAVAKELLEKGASIEWKTSGLRWVRDWVGDYYFTQVVAIHLQEKKLHDADLQVLEDLPALERLYLAGNPLITDATIGHLQGLKHLRRLALCATGITDDGLTKLATLQELEALDIKHTQVTQAGLSRLAPLPNLEELYHRFEFTDEGLAAVAQLPVVHFRELQVQELSEQGFALLPKIRFSGITLQSPQVPDWPRFLYHHPTMGQIVLSDAAITDEQAKQLIKTNDLYKVILTNVPVSDQVLPALAALGNWLSVHVKGTKISANGFLTHFGDRKPLKISISEESISMSSMGLPSLYLSYTGPVPLDDIPGLAHLSDADYLSVSSKKVAIDLSHLPSLPSLSGCYFDAPLNDTALAGLSHQPSLGTIAVKTVGDQFTPNGLRALKGCPCLETLLLDAEVPLTDKHLAAISACKQLQSLAIVSHGEITPQGIAYLADLPQLTELSIGFKEQPDGEVLAEIAKLKKLETLKITESIIKDENIPSLMEMTHLKELIVFRARMSAAGKERLRLALPGVLVEVYDQLKPRFPL
ncbi:hypothetical protein DTL42_17285 [Bremerella cremea]|uniref:Leucine Rich repeats (2 copies) n=1 Tax=Bremerella cremea TaxID=1031537 RepID=A0A368KN93_9BACT|nr:hypothetical protein [Bremerella cremea]RCS44676.1 hypothetical protein DTL42_17285 [Bremerella cremea]